MRLFRLAAAAVAAAIAALGALPAHAQAPLATVVASCPPARATPYPVSNVDTKMPMQPLTVDINGVLCTNASGGGGGGGDSNITQVGGITVTGQTPGSLPVTVVAGSLTTVSTLTNLAQFGGAAINLGAGAVGPGTLRITQASDSPEISALGAVGDSAWGSGNGSQIAILKTIAIGISNGVGTAGAAVPSNIIYTGGNVATNLRGWTGVNPSGSIYAQQHDLASIAGTTVDTNSGNKSAGTQRVVLATDQPNLTTALNVALAANQSVNTAQVNGITVLTGTGATGTGAQRVTVSTDQATNAGAALKNGGVGVVNGASGYQHIAASASSTVLGATGAAGDYLSHCVIYPGTTAAGSVTVFDSTNTAANIAIEFTSGTLSNLAPIPIPVGAISVNGAWKITSGTNVTVACFGKFT